MVEQADHKHPYQSSRKGNRCWAECIFLRDQQIPSDKKQQEHAGWPQFSGSQEQNVVDRF